MGLPVPKEPVEVKEFIKEVRSYLGSGNDVKNDSLAVWSFNKLPKYLWNQWGGELRRRGITWQKFLRILRLRTEDMIEWALRESLSWEKLVKKIEKTINNYYGG